MIDKNDPKLTAYAMDALSGADATDVEKAIADSAELAVEVAEIRAAITALENAFADERALELSADQKLTIEAAAKSVGPESGNVDSLVTRAAGGDVGGATVGTFGARPWRRWLLAAAIGGLLVGGSIFLANPTAQRVQHTAAHKELGFESQTASAPAALPSDPSDLAKISQEKFEPLLDLMQSTVRPENPPERESIAVGAVAGVPDMGTDRSGDAMRADSLRLEIGDSPTVIDDKGKSGIPLGDGTGGGRGGQGLDFQQGQEDLSRGMADDRTVRMGMGEARGAGRQQGEQQLGGSSSLAMGAAVIIGAPMEGADGEEPGDDSFQDPQDAVRAMAPARVPASADIAGGDEGRMSADGRTAAFPDSEVWLDQRRFRAKFKSQRLTESFQEESEVVRQLKRGKTESIAKKRATGFFAGDEINIGPESGRRESDETDDAGKDGQQSGTSGGKGGEIDNRKSNQLAKLKKAKQKKFTRTWKRVKAIPNTTRLMVGDKEELDLTGMQVNVQIDGFRARVLIDYLYYNDRDRQLEGNFKLRLPEDSSLYYFAFGESANELGPQRQLAGREFIDSGTRFVSFTPTAVTKARSDVWRNVKEARMVPREQAAYAFRETVRRRVDPALVEWSGAGVFNAKVFPLTAKKVHRIVVGYDVNLTRTGDQLTYRLDLPESTGDCRIEINAQDIEGVKYDIEPAAEPVEVDHNDQLHQRFTFEAFDARPGNGIRLTATAKTPLLIKSGELDEPFWATQVTPDLPVEESAGSSRAMFLLDTSLSSSPDKFNVWLKLLETTLTNNRDTMKEFGVLMFSIDGRFWKPQYIANTDDNVTELKATLENLVLEGATNLYAAIQKVTATDWVTAGEAPDLFLLSDGAANWGETNQRLIGRLLTDNKMGSLFAYQTGMTGTAIANLRFLTGQTGGAVFSVASEAEIATASTAHRKRPWRLKTVLAAGASDVMTAGRVDWVYPGQTLTIVGRGTAAGPLSVNFQQAEQTVVTTVTPKAIVSELAGRMYGQVSVGQLESMGNEVFDLSAAYARHFRITGQTCSLLMLESEEDYQRFDIKPQEDEFVIKSKPASKLVTGILEKAQNRLADPKAQLLSWLKRLETMQGMKFKMPTALELAIDDIEVVAVSRPLDCSLVLRDDVSKGYLSALQQEALDYDVIAGQAKKRGRQSIDDSIKVFSSLIERNPGDVGIARDVAFTAMELDRPSQAYHLLRSVARQRPFQGSIYPAIGQCLAQIGQSDMAIVYYEVALAGEFQRQGMRFREIVAVDYMHLLRGIVSGKRNSSVKDFARARLETLVKKFPISKSDLLVTMMWNQDQTDVDLHVIEPSGEECYYSHNKTNSGGQITDDITTGFGPEMYFNQSAPAGKYQIAVKFFGNSQNRTTVKNKVYLTVFEGFGSDQEKVTRRTIRLKDTGEHRTVMAVER